MSIELFVYPPTPRAFKVMVVANHLGLDWVLRHVDIVKGEQRLPAYAAMNPNMRIPTLKHGDYVLWEAHAINQYLASLRPDSGLLPTDIAGHINVARWQFWDLAHWEPACTTYIFENLVKPHVICAGPPDAEAIEKNRPAFERAAAALNQQLAASRFVAGDTLTLADFGLAAPLIYAEIAQLPLQPYPEIRRWHAEISALPAWQQTMSHVLAPSQAEAA
jgi:glutathione S-transferase